jgi:hypothetical protein
MPQASIENIVFDIGWVFVHFDYAPLRDFLSARGVAGADLHAMLERAALSEHECGRCGWACSSSTRRWSISLTA